MKIDISAFEDFAAAGKLRQGDWGDARETACLMSGLTGATDVKGCAAAGWPEWLAELGILIFDKAPNEIMVERGRAFAEAVKAAEDRGADFDRAFRDIRLTSILPIAMKAIGDGDDPWRVACREVVQWSIDHDGKAADAADAALAAEAAAHTRIFSATITALRGEQDT